MGELFSPSVWCVPKDNLAFSSGCEIVRFGFHGTRDGEGHAPPQTNISEMTLSCLPHKIP